MASRNPMNPPRLLRGLAGAAVLCAMVAGAQAQTALLNTGSTASGSTAPFALLSGSAYAEDFSVAAGNTVDIGSLAVYLSKAAGSSPTGTVTFSLYSGTFLGAHAPKTLLQSTSILLPTLSTTPQWAGTTLAAPWAVTNSATAAANYWLVVSFSGGAGVDLPQVTNTGVGTTPALSLAYSSTNASFTATSTANGWVGLEALTPVPEPGSVALLIAGLGGLAMALTLRRRPAGSGVR